MGSAASLRLNEELQSLYNEINGLIEKGVGKDIELLKEQQSYTFKKHKDVIIKILAMRGKDYLNQLTKQFDRNEYNRLLGENNQYCNFLWLLSKPSYEIDLIHIDIAVNGVGINEMSICTILGVMNKYELKDICDGYYEKYKKKLIDVILGKINKQSAASTFFEHVLKCDRDESTNVNELNASNAATELHNLLSGFICSRDQQNKVISILCNENRKTCHAISSEYNQQFKKTLESSISSVFSKALALGINTYCAENSIEASAWIFNNCSDSKLYEYCVAKLEKSHLEKVDTKAKHNFTQKLTGNFKTAVEAYMESPQKTPDGNLDALSYYLKEVRLKKGIEVSSLLEDTSSEHYLDVKNYLQKAITSLHQYLGDQDSKPSTEKKVTKNVPMSKKNSKMIESYEQKEKLLTAYLRLQFDTYDTSGEGFLSTEDFWKFMSNLPMEFLGFTQEEVAIMQEFCDWDQDGQVSFDEVIGELVDTLITSIDANMEEGNFKKKIDVLYQLMSNDQNNSNQNSIAPDLKKYLRDSFEAYDIDKNGSLDSTEFWNLLQAMNLGIGESDYDAVMDKWDGNCDGIIQWNEAIEQFSKIINDLASDKRDHYIGLIDKASNCLFWYNLRDQSSSWMSEEEMLYYGPKAQENESITTSAISRRR